MPHALVVDDNKNIIDAMLSMLNAVGLPARGVLSPASAMAILEGDVPDVVFLDINMPGLNGFEVLGFLKREPRFMKVPVIVVTSDESPETTRRALRLGANSVILKPVMTDILEKTLKKIGLP